jgi:predicted regulator of Ras-like GTPase activity (Roadblock/LC7/MglB family)
MVKDEIRRLSDELANNPASTAFLRLGELFRQARQLDDADRVAQRGRERHVGMAAAHDLVARIALDRGDIGAAAESWRAVLRLDSKHVEAHKGLGFLAYRSGRLREAADHLTQAAAASPDDGAIAKALETVNTALRAAAPARPSLTPASAVAVVPPRANVGSVFADLSADAETILLVDRDGLVLAGSAPVGGIDRGAEIGAHLSGISGEADRAMRHLDLGAWTSIVIESLSTSVAISPAGEEGVVLAAAPHSTPLGLLRRLLDRAAERARTWLGPSS